MSSQDPHAKWYLSSWHLIVPCTRMGEPGLAWEGCMLAHNMRRCAWQRVVYLWQVHAAVHVLPALRCT